MATISSAAIASKLNRTPTMRFTTVFSSSSSVFYGDHINNQIGLRLAVDRPRRVHTRVPELVVIAGVVALVFGPKKLPEVGRSIGKTVKSFQQAAKELESELKKETESSEEPPADKITAVGEEEKQEAKVPSMKELSQV
ncbi:unnamed protein product [Fraxinus pennsylvanica]|uniref:Sec-independent protein translocase protein TATA, chloroplastic n=1 Tax=Fraxinus pennsylvanica TaxID=56036 RepID=A0AAD1Z979_9LAMI|nr:unnamed protein product [Fraxinus pennsylvanica]